MTCRIDPTTSSSIPHSSFLGHAQHMTSQASWVHHIAPSSTHIRQGTNKRQLHKEPNWRGERDPSNPYRPWQAPRGTSHPWQNPQERGHSSWPLRWQATSGSTVACSLNVSVIRMALWSAREHGLNSKRWGKLGPSGTSKEARGTSVTTATIGAVTTNLALGTAIKKDRQKRS